MLMKKQGGLEISIGKQKETLHSGYPISTFDQFLVLLKRCTLCINRDKVSTVLYVCIFDTCHASASSS